MGALAYTVAFEGVEARPVEVQCAVSPGVPGFAIVGLPDKAVSEARERVRAALTSMAIALPSKRITVNLSPADLPKEGSHFDLPIALGLLAALGVIPAGELAQTIALGELTLEGGLVAVAGALPAALAAASEARSLLCPLASGREAAWVDSCRVLGAAHLADIIRHFSGTAPIPPARPGTPAAPRPFRDMADVIGQERARRALEIAAAGRHHLLFVGPPGNGKTTLASCLPGILPPLTPREALETSLVHSVAGQLKEGALLSERPFVEEHHTVSKVALVGGGPRARPGSVSLAHNGVLFLDELPEFQSNVLEALRQPLERGTIPVSRAGAHATYPCRILLIAAANPCRCGHAADPARACSRAPVCSETYLGRLSGPLLDRFDMRIEVPPVPFDEMQRAAPSESSACVADRVAAARSLQQARLAPWPDLRTNADATGRVLGEIAPLDAEGAALLTRAADRFGLTLRGYHRIQRLARTIADLDGAAEIRRAHLSEALSYRLVSLKDS